MYLFKKATALILCVCTALSLCGCNLSSDKNKIISIDVDGEPKNIDPLLASSDSELIIARNTLTGLFRIDENGDAEKSLCKSHSVSSDGLVHTFEIKSAKWSNGDKITADDFVFGITRALTAQTKSPYAASLFYIKNGERFYNGEVAQSELGIVAVDKKTVKITLERPISDLPYRLSDISAMPCNRSFFNECKGKYGLSRREMLYCGPFYLSGWTDKSIKLTRNGDYAGGEVKPAEVTMTYGATSDERIESIKKGVIDMAVIDSAKQKQANDAGLKTTSVKGTVWTLVINPNAPIAGTELGSSALTKSLDRAAIEASLDEGYSVFSGLIAPDLTVCGEKYGSHIKEYTQQPMNAELAKQEYMQAINDAGKGLNGATLLYVEGTHMHELAVKIAASWQSNLDAYINTEGVSASEMKKRLKSGNYTVALYPIGYGEYDAERVLQQFISGSADNIFGIADDEFDRIMADVTDKASAADKAKALHQAESRLIENSYICPIALSSTVVARTASMTGCIFDLNRGNFDFANTGK